MNYLEKSRKEFIKTIRRDDISKNEWDAYVQKNYLYSALTLQIHEFSEADWSSSEDKFELLKKKLKKWWYL